MDGLYALKPWYAARLSPVHARLVAANVSPSAVSAAGVVFAGAAAAGLAVLSPGPVSAAVVGVALAGRLACANLDGTVARASGRTTALGAVANELGDRVADLVVVLACCVVAPPAVVLTAALCATLPSLVSLTGVQAGLPRRQSGPMGKTERAVMFVVIAAVGHAVPLLVVIAVGSSVTAALRCCWIVRRTRGSAS